MNATGQRLCAWSGIACIAVFFTGFAVVAGFIPPPSPDMTGDELIQLFNDDQTRIRIGMIISIFASVLLGSWAAVFTVQMHRMERSNSALAYTNLAMGATFTLEFIVSLVIWQSMTFRDHGPDVMTAMNDTAWFLFVCITATPALQAIVIGTAILRDSRTAPVFPRWAGYLNLWVAVMFMPGTITVFFTDGPFAWNGLFVWYMPLTVFAIWIVTNTVLLLKAITAQEAEERTTTVAHDLGTMASDIRQLKTEIARLSARAPTT
jgi:hypothetical protein